MSKKITMKHALGTGKVATRQTARAYTHVVIARWTPEAALLLLATERKSQAQIVREATRDWNHAQQIIRAGVGGRAFFHPNQGGAYLNRSGIPQYEVQDFDVRLAQEYHGGTLEQDVAKAIADEQDWCEKVAANYKSRSTEQFVYSWHGSQRLAEKAAASYSRSYATTVEQINDGVRPAADLRTLRSICKAIDSEVNS